MNTALIHSIAILFVATTTAACGIASAADTLPQRTVSYADLNLSNPEGVQTLYRRLSGAAKQVCKPIDSTFVAWQRSTRKCTKAAMNKAVADVNNANLTAYHDEKTNAATSDGTKFASRR